MTATAWEAYKVKTAARIRLVADYECKKCQGKGVVVASEYSAFSKKLEVDAHLCGCIKAELVGKPRLPKRPIPAEGIVVIENSPIEPR